MENDSTVEEMYAWVDEIPLSRPKKKISRDFSDGVLMAELLKHSYPKLVDLHNYYPASSKAFKLDNWSVLNRKVFSKLNMKLSQDVIDKLVEAVPGTVEDVLIQLYAKVKTDKLNVNNDMFDLAENHQIFSRGDDDHQNASVRTSTNHSLLCSLKKDVMVKDEAIAILKDKVTHLENLLELKNQRIRDLSTQLLRYQTSAECAVPTCYNIVNSDAQS